MISNLCNSCKKFKNCKFAKIVYIEDCDQYEEEGD